MSEADGVRILIAAGGTAGHVVPALAVAEALRERGAEVVFVGGRRAEATLVPAAGFPFRAIEVEGLSRTHPLRAARALLRAALAVGGARRIIAELRPAAVMGGGGYVSGPVGLAALSARVPLVLTEADSHLGLANRLLARGARRVCLAFPPADRRHVPSGDRRVPPSDCHGVSPADRRGAESATDGRGRYVVTGRPVFPAHADRDGARARFGLAPQERCVLVFGGSLGARSLNVAAIEALAGLPVLHICGKRDYPDLAARELPPSYRLIEYLDLPDFNEALAAADLVLARSGGSVFEIAAHGLPAILVPYPHAASDHQSANARWMSEAGAAVVIPDAQLTPERLREQALRLLADGARLARMAAASRSLARPDAAAKVAEILLREAAR